MDDMSRGFFGRFRRGRGARETGPELAAARPKPPRAIQPAAEADDQALELAFDIHFCCICGNPLGFDREDELDGEGPGRDICGPCNRTRNFDSIEMGW